MKFKISNMCMILKENRVLVQKRTKKDWPGITFPGGKVELNESIYDSTIREVKEETGLDVKNLTLSGIVHYQVSNQNEQWIIFLYKTDQFEGHICKSESEDEVFWMDYGAMKQATLSNDLDKYIAIYEDAKFVEGFAYWDGCHSHNFIFKK